MRKEELLQNRARLVPCILRSKNMSLLEFAKKEMEILNGKNVDEMQQLITKNILELIEVFAKQDHSGMSANYCLNLFNKLAKYKPLTPISFEENQWKRIGKGMYQHKRNFGVFKDGKDGRPYYIHAYTMCWKNEPDNCWGGGIVLKHGRYLRRCYIKDPAKMPTIKILISLEYNHGNGDWEFEKIGKRKLRELKKYYDLDIIKNRRK